MPKLPCAGSEDVVVVGAGAVGVTVALELARRGRRVTLIERSGDLAAGCSRANAGFTGPGHAAPIATPAKLREGLGSLARRNGPFRLSLRPTLAPWLMRFVLSCRAPQVEVATQILRALSMEGLTLHAKLAAEGIDTGFRTCGRLEVFGTMAGLEKGRLEAAHYVATTALRAEELTPAEALCLEPALNGGLVGAIYYPDETGCDPLRYVQGIAAAAVEAGVLIETGVELQALSRQGRRFLLKTSAGTRKPLLTVMATGIWSAHLLRMAGIHIPLEAGLGYSIDVANARIEPRTPVYLNEARTIVTNLGGRLRLVGLFVLGGRKGHRDSGSVRRLFEAASRGIQGADEWSSARVWSGLRPCTPDALPVIGSPPDMEDLTIATGHGMLGLQLAPVTARILADHVSGAPVTELIPLAVDRFRSWPQL